MASCKPKPKQIVAHLVVHSLVGCLVACSIGAGSSAVDEQAAVWRQEEADLEARQDVDLGAHAEARVRDEAEWQATQQQAAVQEDAKYDAWHRATAGVAAAMHECLTSKALTMARTQLSARQAADAILAICKPSIEALARSVVLVDLPSSGLAQEMTIRIKPKLEIMVTRDREQAVWRRAL